MKLQRPKCVKTVGDVKHFFNKGNYTIEVENHLFFYEGIVQACLQACVQSRTLDTCGCYDARYPADGKKCEIKDCTFHSPLLGTTNDPILITR